MKACAQMLVFDSIEFGFVSTFPAFKTVASPLFRRVFAIRQSSRR